MFISRLGKRKLINFIQSTLLFLTITLVLSFVSFVLFGFDGIIYSIILLLVIFTVVPKINPQKAIDKSKAYELRYEDAEVLYTLLEKLSKNSQINTPKLFFLPSDEIRAFSSGDKEKSVILISKGILEFLDLEELYGVLGHEISHIKNNDIWYMYLSSIISTMVVFLSSFTALLLYTLMVLADINVNLFDIALFMIVIPFFLLTVQFSLSRVREYQADLDSVYLTGNVKYLKNALVKLNSLSRKYALLNKILNPHYTQTNEFSWFNTHPSLKNRIKKLSEIEE